MTIPTTPGNAPEIRCPFCLELFRWDGQGLHEWTEAEDYKPLDVSMIVDPVKQEDRLRNAFVVCPASEHGLQHFLPLDYMRYSPPLVIGLVGASSAGKSTMLAVMVNEIDRGGLNKFRFTARPLVRERHEEFRRTKLKELILDGKRLDRTAKAVGNVQFADAFLLVSESDMRPVVFFDVAGENLADPGPATRFLQAVNALIFVVDPDRVLGRVPGSRGADGKPMGDDAFKAVLDTLIPPDGAPAQYLDIPAAIVLGKADTLRFEPPIARWLAEQNGLAEAVDAGKIRAESRDVYAFLYQNHGNPWLEPFNRFRQCTLHVMSATGSSPVNQSYPRGLRPRRVLEPLVAILSMTGVISGAEADQVGR
jgi:hypothetical protein